VQHRGLLCRAGQRARVNTLSVEAVHDLLTAPLLPLSPTAVTSGGMSERRVTAGPLERVIEAIDDFWSHQMSCCTVAGSNREVALAATHDEKKIGSAATGRYNRKVLMDRHTWCEQLPPGPFPGDKFLQFTPSGVTALMAEKRAIEQYMALKLEIDECGGQDLQGWTFGAIYDVINSQQHIFAERGIHVALCLTSFVENGHHEVSYRGWLQFADKDKMSIIESVYAFEPETDYARAALPAVRNSTVRFAAPS